MNNINYLILFFQYIFIFLEISVYIKQFATRLLTIICIYLSNFFYGMGTFMYFFGLRKMKDAIRVQSWCIPCRSTALRSVRNEM